VRKQVNRSGAAHIGGFGTEETQELKQRFQQSPVLPSKIGWQQKAMSKGLLSSVRGPLSLGS
jgi:hypothetical protein